MELKFIHANTITQYLLNKIQRNLYLYKSYSRSQENMSGNKTLKPFLIEEKWGFRDNKGNIVVSPIWDYADYFHEGFAVVRNDKGLYGYIDSNGQPLRITGTVLVIISK